MRGIAWKRWNWIEGGLIPLISAIMHVSWLALFNQRLLESFLVSPNAVQFPAWLMVVILLGASGLERLSQRQETGRLRSVLAGLLVIVVVVGWQLRVDMENPGRWLWDQVMGFSSFGEGIPVALYLTLFTALLWRQGLVMRWIEYNEFWRGFVGGVIVFTLMLAFPRFGLPLAAPESIWLNVGVFLISGLLGLALIAVSQSLAYERSRGTRTPGLNRYWLVAVATVIALVLLTGYILGQIFSPTAVATVLGLLQRVLSTVWSGIAYVLTLLVWLLARLFAPLFQSLQSVANGEQPEVSLALETPEPLVFEETIRTELPTALASSLRVAFVILVILGVAALLFLAWRRRRRPPQTDSDEERDFVFSGELLMQQLRNMFRRTPRAAVLSPYLSLEDPGDTRQAIRLLYQRLLARLKIMGRPRMREETPHVYEQQVQRKVSGAEAALATLTQAYAEARYASDPPALERLEQARQAWEQLEQTLEANAPPKN